jgi:glycosyltransferase involved in cell wall biosynthesis
MMKKKNQKLITHVDGREEQRGKYSALKKMYVRICQRFALQGDHLIADSHAIENHWKKKYPYSQNKISTIEYGANRSDAIDLSPLEKLGLSRDEYYLVVCRMVPENNVAMIVDGFKISGSGKKLVLVGATDNSTGLQMKKHESEFVIFPGSIYDKKWLAALRSGCFAYIHGHSVGGTNPSLLESMAVGSICICHDNPYNRETMLNGGFYFHSAEELAGCIRKAEHSDVKILDGIKEGARRRIQDRYNWDRITNEYCNLFESLTKDGR